MISTTVNDVAAPSVLAQIEWVFQHIARLQGVHIDRLRLQAALSNNLGRGSEVRAIQLVSQAIDWPVPTTLAVPDRARLPLLAYSTALGWVVLVEREPDGRWRCAHVGGTTALMQAQFQGPCIVLQAPDVGEHNDSKSGKPQASNFSAIMKQTMRAYRPSIAEAVVATLFMGLLTLMTSLFSMQVYDRVIPTRGEYTLAVLSAGVLLTVVLELILKFVRSNIMDRVAVGVDHRLSREIFQRLLQLRVDQIPASVGSLAGQLRGYEQVRNFYTASTLFALVDLPLAIVFLGVIAVISHPFVALVPVAAMLLAISTGLLARRTVNRLAETGAKFSYLKTGLLVEAVEGVETIKSGSGGWKFLARWLKLNHNTIDNDMSMRRSSDSINYYAAAIQQLSYAGVVAVGALVVMQGGMTMGALIAASILCGRVLSPILMMPNLFVQQAHAKAALLGLDKLYELKTDNHGMQRVLVPEHIRGDIKVEGVKFAYGLQQNVALGVEALEIRPGERIGVVGPIGSGKSTLLRLISGMYVPNSGRVLLDGLDLAFISRDVINRYVGYLQQEHRLFQGTLRENLLIGLPDPGDEQMLQAMRRTGMDKLVQGHPLGLERPIAEGGKGLSGGQRQLLAFTRLMLTNPTLLLLDEPTANMDQEQERHCLGVLQEEIAAGKSMIIVTHKLSLLPLVDRILVVVGGQVIIDGPRDQVIQSVAANSGPAPAPGPQPGNSPGVFAKGTLSAVPPGARPFAANPMNHTGTQGVQEIRKVVV